MKQTTGSRKNSKKPGPAVKHHSEGMSSTLRCFQAMEMFASPPYEFALSEVAIDLSLPLATAHRVIATLCAAGVVQQDPITRRYSLSGKALWLGTGFLRHSHVYRAAFLILQEVARTGYGLVHLGTIDGDAVLYLHTVGSPSALYLYADTGERRPLYCTALGKAMLAYQPPDVVTRALTGKLDRLTPKTITSAGEIRSQLALIGQRAFAIDDEENAPGLRCVAAPILNQAGISIAAVSISAHVSVMTDDVLAHCSSIVREAALRVSTQLGYRPATSNYQSIISEFSRRGNA